MSLYLLPSESLKFILSSGKNKTNSLVCDMANLRAMSWFSYATTACAIESYIKISKAFGKMGRRASGVAVAIVT